MTKRAYARTTHDYDRVFRCIVEYKRDHDGNSPSTREITAACGITSTSVVRYILRDLAERGKILLTDKGSRNIEIPGAKWVYSD